MGAHSGVFAEVSMKNTAFTLLCFIATAKAFDPKHSQISADLHTLLGDVEKSLELTDVQKIQVEDQVHEFRKVMEREEKALSSLHGESVEPCYANVANTDVGPTQLARSLWARK